MAKIKDRTRRKAALTDRKSAAAQARMKNIASLAADDRVPKAKKRKGEVVFLGVNSNDNDDNAEEFLRENPVPFPHFRDPDLEVAASFNGVQAFPTTAFYDKQGELAFVHQGGYASEHKLAEDIDRYAR